MKLLVLLTGTNETLKYAESLEMFGPVSTLQYDVSGRSDQLLFDKAKEAAPDFIAYIGSRWGYQPTISTLSRINEKLAPMVHICSDAADQPWWDLLREYHQCGAFSLQIAIDGSTQWPTSDANLTLLTPINPALFGEPIPHAQRAVKFGYAGNAGGGPASQRTVLLTELLRQRVLDLRIRSNLPYTYEAMCDYLENCRISLNIAYTGTESTTHVKGRVIESGLAGCCLLETKGSPVSKWFTPGVDYLEYSSADEAVTLMRELIDHPEVTQAMGLALRAKILAEHTPTKFWAKIFNRVGVKP